MAKYKQRCIRCKKNYIVVTRNQRFPICYECQKTELNKPIKNTKMRKMFDIPKEFYIENIFLRDIKLKYLKFGELTEKQIAAFKKTVKEMKETNK